MSSSAGGVSKHKGERKDALVIKCLPSYASPGIRGYAYYMHTVRLGVYQGLETVMKSSTKISHDIVNITPALAKHWLDESHFDNRRLDDRNVDKIARDICNNKWVFDGTPIRFDHNGNVLDGQHRLYAIVRANKPIDSLVVRGLSDVSKHTIDTGKSRSPGDVLHFYGFVNTNALANACRLYIGYQANQGDMRQWLYTASSKVRVSAAEMLNVAQGHPILVDAVNSFSSTRFCKQFIGQGTTALCYYILKKHTMQTGTDYKVDGFFNQVEKGADLQDGSPILALRNALISLRQNNAALRKGGNAFVMYRTAFVFKAWNAIIAEKPIQVLRFTETEKFPMPE